MSYRIRPGTVADGRALQDVERAAGKLFLTVGMPEIAANDPTSIQQFESRAREGRLLVVEDQGNARPAGFLCWSPIDGCAYTEELAVDPAHAGHRLGARLIDVLAKEARTALTLATFRDVPWNAPYYARLGFVECDHAFLGPDHEKEWRKQSDHGLDMSRRLFMSRPRGVVVIC